MTYYSTNPQRLSLLGHISFGVKSMAISEPFYNAVFRSFGIVQVYRDKAEGSPATVCGWGARPAARGVAPEEPFTLFERSDVRHEHPFYYYCSDCCRAVVGPIRSEVERQLTKRCLMRCFVPGSTSRPRNPCRLQRSIARSCG